MQRKAVRTPRGGLKISLRDGAAIVAGSKIWGKSRGADHVQRGIILTKELLVPSTSKSDERGAVIITRSTIDVPANPF